MRIYERKETITYTVDADQWKAKVSKFGEEGATLFLCGTRHENEWRLVDVEEDEFGIFAQVTLVKEYLPSKVYM